MSALVRRFRNAFHNCVLHPVAGLLWFLGFQAAGDRVHGEPKPRWWLVLLDGPESPQVKPHEPPPASPYHPQQLLVHAGRLTAAAVFAADHAEAYRTALALVVSAGRTRAWQPDRVL